MHACTIERDKIVPIDGGQRMMDATLTVSNRRPLRPAWLGQHPLPKVLALRERYRKTKYAIMPSTSFVRSVLFCYISSWSLSATIESTVATIAVHDLRGQNLLDLLE